MSYAETCGGARGVPVAPLVRDDHVVARVRQYGHLVTPGEGVLGPAVAEHARVPCVLVPCFEHFELDAVDGDDRGIREAGGVIHLGTFGHVSGRRGQPTSETGQATASFLK